MEIWKWTLGIGEAQTIKMPQGAQILDVQMQGERPQLWALCDESKPKEDRRFVIYGTGDPIIERLGRYIATFQLFGGTLVFHAFELE